MNSKNWQLPLTRSQKYDLDRAIVEYIRWNYEHSSGSGGGVGFRESLATLDDVTLTEENIARSLELLFNLDGDTATTGCNGQESKPRTSLAKEMEFYSKITD